MVAPGASTRATSRSPTSVSSPPRPRHRLVSERDPRPRAAQEPRRDNKYSAGSVLVVGGSPGMSGAAALCSRAAFRADAGYVAVAAPAESLADPGDARGGGGRSGRSRTSSTRSGRAGALALGPGLGRSPEKKELVRRLLEETDVPAVVDADALYELEPFEREAPTVLTPHAGELGRLIGEESSWVDAHRLEALRRAVERFGCVVPAQGRGHADRRSGEGRPRPRDATRLPRSRPRARATSSPGSRRRSWPSEWSHRRGRGGCQRRPRASPPFARASRAGSWPET